MTTENFVLLSEGKTKDEDGQILTYKNTIFTQVFPGLIAVGGNNAPDKTPSGKSIYGGPFANEKEIKAPEKMYIGMTPTEQDKNGSVFGIFLKEVELKGLKPQIFGEVLEGQETVELISQYGTETGRPKAPIRIVEAGKL